MSKVTDSTDLERLPSLPRDADGFVTTSTATARLEERLTTFLEETVEDAGAEGLVVTLDGGLDTTVTATLAVEALGADRVTALVMPAYISREAAARDAEAVAEALDVGYDRIHLQPLLAGFQSSIEGASGPADDLVATSNALARFRMACAYYAADTQNALVVGAVDRTDCLLGTVTKYGELGADCLPIGDLYTTEVRALARRLEIPDNIVDQHSNGGPRDARFDVEDLEVDAETVDRILRLHVDEALEIDDVTDRVDVDRAVVERIATRCGEISHKRRLPLTPSRRR